MGFIAGQYTVTFGDTPASIGQIADGITVEHFVNKQLITGDNLALTPQDAVYQGEEVFIEFTCLEWDNANVKQAFWPYSASYGTMGTVGTLDSNSTTDIGWTQLVLTAVQGPPANPSGTGDPLTLTAPRAVLAEGYPVRVLFAPALRDIPLRFRLYPDGSNRFYVITTAP